MAVTFALRLKRAPVPAAASSARGDGLFLQGQGGRALLLVHGLTGTPQEMKFLATFFHRKGYTVLVPRLANHGAPMDVLKYTRWQACYASVRAAYLEHRAAHPDDTVVVAGLSMGALLALLLSTEFPGQIAAVGALSPTLFYDGWNTPWYRHLLLPLCAYTPLEHFFYFKEEPPYGIKNEAIRRRVHAYYKRARLSDTDDAAQYGYPYIPATLFHELHRLVQYVMPRLSQVTAPVQLIQASEDDITSIKNSQLIYARIRSAHKELVLLHNSYHVITADQERDTVAQRLDVFFDRVQRGPGVDAPSAETAAVAS